MLGSPVQSGACSSLQGWEATMQGGEAPHPRVITRGYCLPRQGHVGAGTPGTPGRPVGSPESLEGPRRSGRGMLTWALVWCELGMGSLHPGAPAPQCTPWDRQVTRHPKVLLCSTGGQTRTQQAKVAIFRGIHDAQHAGPVPAMPLLLEPQDGPTPGRAAGPGPQGSASRATQGIGI